MCDPAKCAQCDKDIATESCDMCGNDFCVTCLEEHRHCINCGGTGVERWNVMKNKAGELDYLYGEPSGETVERPCRRCEESGIEY